MARAKGLKKGIKNWEIEIEGVADKIFWSVNSFENEKEEPNYSALGQSFVLDLRSGSYKFSEWVKIE